MLTGSVKIILNMIIIIFSSPVYKLTQILNMNLEDLPLRDGCVLNWPDHKSHL